MRARLLSVLLSAAVMSAGGGAAAAATARPGTQVPGPTASASAFAVRIVFPGGRVVGARANTGAVAAPSFAYPSDGSVIVTGLTRAGAKASEGGTATAAASAEASNISIFQGEITADSAAARASAAASGRTASGGLGGTGVVHLQALGRPHAAGQVPLASWGSLAIARRTIDRAAAFETVSYAATSVALEIRLTAPHGGLPAGTEIDVGYAAAQAQSAPPVPVNAGPRPADQPQLLPPATGPLLAVPQLAAPPLTAGPYVFPVYGASSYRDDYGDARQSLSWQHGVDILGQLGQPLVAAAAGTLYSVGWTPGSGNRLWLRDGQGNEFLYAHLAAFATLARNGAQVSPGQVVGFMGDTGNSGGLGNHLHFELHPVSMLFVGVDGAVDPTAYFPAWRRISNLAVPVASGWAPKVAGTVVAPRPGAVLIGSTDISSADGLDPASLRRVLRPSAGG